MAEAGTARAVTEALRNQFDSSFAMLEKLAEVCPDPIWRAYFNGDPFWYHVYHSAYFVEYWIRADYGSQAHGSPLGKDIPPEFEREITGDLCVTKEEMAEYMAGIKIKTDRAFDRLDDSLLALPVAAGREHFTHADVITGQIRHVMYNVGYLNGILRSLGAEESDWYAYNEQSD